MKSAHQSTTLMSPLNEKFTYLVAAGYSKPALVDNNRFRISPELTKEEFYRMEQTVSLSQQGEDLSTRHPNIERIQLMDIK